MRFSEDRIEKLDCSDGVQRDIHIWEPEKPRAVFLAIHGLMDHGGNFMNLGLALRTHGFATAAHDQHGHDRKRKAHVPRFGVFLDDLELMLTWTRKQYPGIPIFMVGHSMGGLILTHFGIERYQEDPMVRGFILSSPGYSNSLKTSGMLIALGKLLSVIAPKVPVPIEDLRPLVTHDQQEYERMREDERDGIQATRASARLAAEFLKAQDWIPAHIAAWKYPLLAIVSGNDKLIDSEASRHLLGKIKEGLLTEIYYPENYHESFNEVNRNEVFERIVEWAGPRLGK
jgi:alpha-beta hydrolase superfamily lysophospholipase